MNGDVILFFGGGGDVILYILSIGHTQVVSQMVGMRIH